MSVLSRLRPALLLAAIAAAAPAALCADPAPPPATPPAPASPPGFSDRLFLAFSQEAAVVPSQWWEGQLEYIDGSRGIPVNILLVRGVVAFRPVETLEVGGRVGFGTSHASAVGQDDGTGATDLDIYGKWVFPNAASNTDFSAGLLFTVPTGDDTAGLGFNAFSTQAFGAVNHRFDDFALGGHVGVRLNGNGRYQGVPLSGATSFELAGSMLFPLANQVSLVGEAQFETARFDNPNPGSSIADDGVAQILAGINWRAFGRGMFRAAVTAGLTDSAPNFRVLLSYAHNF